ncbi:MAG: hypothetical protein IKB65_02760 [Ruminiclostridium sp.]|nr:hypothetical protein [Ruminiclostridium sp.]
MAKSKVEKSKEIDLLQAITKKTFPRVRKSKFAIYEYVDGCLFHYLKWNETPIRNYVNDNFEKSLLRLIRVIEGGELNEEELCVAKHLLAALTYVCFGRQSDVPQDKKQVVWNLFVEDETFKCVIKEYAGYVPELLGELFYRAFTRLERQTMEEILEDCISTYSKRSENYSNFVGCLPFKFINCFVDLSFWSEETCEEYCLLCEYIDKSLPKLKFKKHQCYIYLHEAKQGLAELNKLVLLNSSIEKKGCWRNLRKVPQYIEFDYIYPNGKNGDILKYIFDEYGESNEKGSLLWHGKIEKKYIHLFELFYGPERLISEDPRFFELYDNHHIPTIIDKRINELSCKHISRFQGSNELLYVNLARRKEQTRKRGEMYSQLILQGKTSPKWKSEAQLYSIVVGLYPDAIYQYRTSWLGGQSLDIYIPSLSIGIEYQGKQHYEPVEYFGGEEHFKHQQENDEKKRSLCNENGVYLIEWPYTEEITDRNLQSYLEEVRRKDNQAKCANSSVLEDID